MKRFFKLSIIVLALLCISTPMTDAKIKKSTRKATTLSSYAFPSPKTFDDIALHLKNPKKVKQMTGLTRLYYSIEKPCRDNHYVEGGSFIYGKNAKANRRGEVTATGPHAFYYLYCSDFSVEFFSYNFSDIADRDKFWNEMANSGEDMSWYGKGYKNGWYTIHFNP